MSKLEEIKARLEAATPTPWELHTKVDHGAWFRITAELDDGWWTICDSAIFGKNEVNNGLMKQVKGNAELIANAPTDIAWLISEVERKSSVHVEQMKGALLDLQYAEARIKKLRAALEKIRNDECIEVSYKPGVDNGKSYFCFLDIAKEALTEDDKAAKHD